MKTRDMEVGICLWLGVPVGVKIYSIQHPIAHFSWGIISRLCVFAFLSICMWVFVRISEICVLQLYLTTCTFHALKVETSSVKKCQTPQLLVKPAALSQT